MHSNVPQCWISIHALTPAVCTAQRKTSVPPSRHTPQIGPPTLDPFIRTLLAPHMVRSTITGKPSVFNNHSHFGSHYDRLDEDKRSLLSGQHRLAMALIIAHHCLADQIDLNCSISQAKGFKRDSLTGSVIERWNAVIVLGCAGLRKAYCVSNVDYEDYCMKWGGGAWFISNLIDVDQGHYGKGNILQIAFVMSWNNGQTYSICPQ